MKRRLFLRATGAAFGAATFVALAQPALAPKRLGCLWPGKQEGGNLAYGTTFESRLRELGWTEGRNLLIVNRYAQGDPRRFESLARELVTEKVDVIHTVLPGSVRAARKGAPETPIVFSFVSDPVGEGFVSSLGRPGGNITGVTTREQELYPKRLQLLKEVLPRAKRVAVLIDTPGQSGMSSVLQNGLKELAGAGERLGVSIETFHVGPDGEIGPAFDRMVRGRFDAVLVFVYGRLRGGVRGAVVEHAARVRLPASYTGVASVDFGGLISFSANVTEMSQRAAAYVDKILRGAPPADLPVEEPNSFELVINKKTARALGLAIPQSILLRADRVIE